MTTKNEEKNDVIKDIIQDEKILTQDNQDTSFSFSELAKDAGRQSLKAIKWLLIVAVSFGLSNIVIFIIALLKYGNRPLDNSSVFLFIMLFIGLVFMGLAISRTYKYILVDTIKIAYKYLTPLFKKVCLTIIDKVIASGNRLTGKRDIESMLNVGSLMIDIYGKKLPGYVQKAVLYILKQVPFSDFLFSMQDDLRSERKNNITLSEMLYQKLDAYLLDIFTNNSMKWLMWFLPLNIILQIALLVYA